MKRLGFWVLSVVLWGACDETNLVFNDDDSEDASDADSDGDSDADSDGDSDADSDADSDGDSDGDADTASETASDTESVSETESIDTDTGECLAGQTRCYLNWVQHCVESSWINWSDCAAMNMVCTFFLGEAICYTPSMDCEDNEGFCIDYWTCFYDATHHVSEEHTGCLLDEVCCLPN